MNQTDRLTPPRLRRLATFGGLMLLGLAAAAPQPALAQGGPMPGSIPAPPDVKAPPEDAEKTASGLASKVLQKGTGTQKPTADDAVRVHYTGWTTEGVMFDSSVARGEPITFPLGRVIAGWTEGVQLMVQGEKRRLWIPPELGYAGNPNAPPQLKGALVFDVELLEIIDLPEAPADLKTPPEDAEKSPTGLITKVLQKGSGTDKPKVESILKAHFVSWTEDGKLFDTSLTNDGPQTMNIRQLEQRLPGLAEGLGLMVEGEKRRMWIPQNIAFKGAPGAPTGTIVFDVELIEIVKEPETPADVAAPPDDAEKTASGLASKVLKPGTGTEKPAATSVVVVHYTGWTTDGNMFDSSIMRGEPATFPLNRVIPGWTEGLQLMVVGEKRRFWIPVELAYKNQPGRPAGMLVFDVELLEIKK